MRALTLCMMGTLVALSLSACTPTINKQSPSPEATQESVADKVPDTDAIPMEVVSVYHVSDDGKGIEKTMEGLEGEGLDPQKLVDKLSEYEVLDPETQVLAFSTKDGILTLDLSAVPQLDGSAEEMLLIALTNTFLENYVDEGVEKVKLLVDGKNYAGQTVTHKDDDYLTMYKNYKTYGQ